MLITLIALATVALSLTIIIGGLRMVAQDTFQMLSASARRAFHQGELLPKAAFTSLWAMIFFLSYL